MSREDSADVPQNSSNLHERRFLLLLSIGLLAAVIYAFYVLLSGLWQPLLDQHSFRQTQTALSVYWLAQGGPWLAYETPVLGAPWAIPFEFPFYQWIVAFLVKTGVPIDGAGRIVSFTFYIATLGPIALFFRSAGLGRAAFLMTAILYVMAPLYLYWSRAFLVESCALFFSALSLALFATYLRVRDVALIVLALLSGVAATLAKATTFPAFAAVGLFLVGNDVLRRYRAGETDARLLSALAPLVALVLPFIVGYGWVIYSDHVKLTNEFGASLTSTNLSTWNLGTAIQRVSSELWRDTIRDRILPDIFGGGVLIAFVAAGAALTKSRFAVAATVAAVAFLLPPLIFTNLHIVHNYYQYANALFAIAIVGIGLASIAETRRPFMLLLAATLLAAMVAGQVIHFRQNFRPWIKRDYSQDARLLIAAQIKSSVPATAGIFIIGDDWASTIPYYSERKGLALPKWTPPALLQKVLADPQAYLGGKPLGAVVLCRDQLPGYKERIPAIERFVEGMKAISTASECAILERSR
jgi:hypothetical protein